MITKFNYLKLWIFFIFIYPLNDSFAYQKISSFFEETSSHSIACGKNTAQLSFKLTGPVDSQLFAIFLSGSPANSYFSDQAKSYAHYIKFLYQLDDPYQKISDNLIKKGYRILEIRYDNPTKECEPAGPVQGFYSACCAAGLEAIKLHSANLYDIAIKKLGYDPSNPKARLVGLGWSLGAIQLQAMALMSGKKFDRIALSGVLMGNSVLGCSSARRSQKDGLSWEHFLDLADSLTLSHAGCSLRNGSLPEYTSRYNFENFTHFTSSHVGLFEGEAYHTDMMTSPYRLTGGGVPGNPQQVEYIVRVRTQNTSLSTAPYLQTVGNTSWKIYPGCGHELLYCSGNQAADDIVDYLDSF